MSAGNQQERLDSYFAGYVDGEGSFHVAIQKIKHVRFGYQLLPEFHVSQNLDYARVLSLIKNRLGCGYIKPNNRSSKTDKSWVYVVRDRQDLLQKVIPFFEKNNLVSPKHTDFEKFAYIVRQMAQKKHLKKEGFMKLLKIAFSMNRAGKYRKQSLHQIIRNLESSTTTC